MRGNRQIMRRGLFAALVLLFLPAATAWGYFFDDRREMSLSGFAYSRVVIATQDGRTNQKVGYFAGNLVSHRNFLTLEWRHNLNRVSRSFPTVGPLFEFLDINALDYYLNVRDEWDGVYTYGPNKITQYMRGTRLHVPFFDDRNTDVPFDGIYFTPFPRSPWPASQKRTDFPVTVSSLSNRRWQRLLRKNHLRLFEWYFNITKGPLFLRIGRQNLSWGETDAFRLLDQINPLDNTFGGFLTSLDERRIPLNMLRAQWSFGTVGPIGDLTLEGFYSIDNKVTPVLPTNAAYFWGGETSNGDSAIMLGRTPCGGDFMAKRGIPAYNFASTDPRLQARFGGRYPGSGPGPRHGGGCSQRGDHPHADLERGRGGGRIIGTIHDFTFSIAHYYTYQDLVVVRANIISPTPDHLRWDLGLSTDSLGRPWPQGNPWGPADPVAARMISSGANTTGRGGIGTVAGVERDVRSTLNFERIQVTGASLSFPVNALTGMFVGSDNPLYYIYTTFRSEIAFFNNVPHTLSYSHLDGNTAFDRFLGGTFLGVAGGAFKPGGALADQAGRRTVHTIKRDYLAWNIGLDHNQWIRWLNPVNSFTISAQQFWLHQNGTHRLPHPGLPTNVLNQRDAIAARQRRFIQPRNAGANPQCKPELGGARDGCSTWINQAQDWLTTLSISTQYIGGNVRPSFVFFFDWSGSFLIQPGLDWTFYDPFRLSFRYNYIDGRGSNRAAIGTANRKDNVWFELQYLLY